MNTEAIKSFLVGLGFGVDDASLAKFNKAIANASLRVTALYASIKIAAAGIFWSISKISQGFEELGYEYRIIAPAINKAMLLRREMLRAYAAAGVNLRQVVIQSVKFNLALTKTQYALKALYSGVAARFFPLLTKQIDTFRNNLYKNMPKIQNMLEKFIKFVFKAFEATIILGQRIWSILTRVYDFFYKLHQQTDGWTTYIIAAVAAWKLLNLEFLATPLGMILTGLVAIAALFDDFKTWQEGGESLFNWTKFVPVIETVSNVLKTVWKILNDIAEVIGNVVLAFYQLFHLDFSGFGESLVNAFTKVIDVVKGVFDTVKGLIMTLGALGKFGIDVFGSNPQASAVSAQRPLGTNVNNNSNTNQHVSQQTSINVSGAADAQGVASAIAGQQDRVNFNMTRNLKARVQ
jgi:hypothetical protein